MDSIARQELPKLDKQIAKDIADQVGAKIEGPKAFVTWVGHDGAVEHGVCRWGFRRQGKLVLSCTPFPGAWVDVEGPQLLRVTAIAATLSRSQAQQIADLPRWGDVHLRGAGDVAVCFNPIDGLLNPVTDAGNMTSDLVKVTCPACLDKTHARRGR
jgi:hypothetical protein